MINWFNHRPPHTKRSLTSFLLSIVFVTAVASSLLIPKPAHAQWIVSDIASAAEWVWSKVQSAASWAYEHGAAMAYTNALRTFTTQVAYDSAVMLASGGEGQTPLFSTKSLKESVINAANDAGGDFVDTLMTGAGQNGFLNINVCQPTSPTAQLIIGWTTFEELKPRQPRCSLTDIKKNWDKFLAPENRANLLKNFGVTFDPKQNDLGIALTVQQNLVTTAAQESKLVLDESMLSEGGFLPLTEKITERIKTPVGQVSDVSRAATAAAVDKSFGDYTGDVLADALGVFTNTLASRIMKKLLQKGSVPSPSRIGSPAFSGGNGGVEYALEVNSDIEGVNLAGSSGVVDIISEFSNCPKDPGFYTPAYACTITPKFADVLRKADEGEPRTVKEAIEKGDIYGNLRFIETRPSEEAFSPTKAWYLSDIRKLRLARIVPLGWELAATEFADTNVTLKQVMDGFNDTGPDKLCGTNDDVVVPGLSVSFCGLIDPNWILRAPPAQCRIEAYGQLIEPSGPNRSKSCVDYQNCIAEKGDGSCEAWGYCTREQNIWRFSGKSCELPEGSGSSPWPTCQSFKDSTGKVSSYLISSLTNYDDGICSDAASCRWYSTARNLNPTGQDDSYLPNRSIQGTQNNINTVDFKLSDNTLPPRFYLKNVDKRTCATNVEGCTKFLQLSNINVDALEGQGLPPGSSYAAQVEKVVNLVSLNTPGEDYTSYEQLASPSQSTMRQAPTYLNCYDINPLNRAPECVNYLQLCDKLEVGCELYTPKDGSPSVPGKVVSDNVCPAECNGFNTYQQASSFFENFLTRSAPDNIEPTENFIPTTAKSCSATYAGCEEFTNVEQNERKEYYSEMRQCVRPEDELDNTYYTWVGSDLTGYQLKTWQLKAYTTPQPDPRPSPLVPPITTDGSGECVVPGVYNPDCKEFYLAADNLVEVYNRLESKVIYSSNSCNRYRATSIIVEDDCANSGGEWDDTAHRCYYRAIPGQGKVCPSSAVSCREYRGPTAGNVRLVFPVSTFGDTEPGVNTDSSPLSGWQGGANSNESTSAFGHSLWSGSDRNIYRDITGQVTQGKQYVLTFWAKKQSGALPPIQDTGLPLPLANIFGIKKASAQSSFVWDFISAATGGQHLTTTSDWVIYNFGPVTLTGDVSSEALLHINGTTGFFIDNITFREVQDTFYVRKNSWVTPSICLGTTTPPLVPPYLRCSAYTTRDRQTVYLTGFEKLCRAEAIGCRALIDTHNSTTPQELQVNVDDGQTVEVPADNVVYRVYDSKKSCSAQFAGCKRLGQPVFDSAGAISGWSDVYTILNPDTFDSGTNPANSPLCKTEQSMCQLYTDGANVPHVFKDPNNKVCEYKNIDAAVGYEWYKKGTSIRCNLITNPSFELLSTDSIVGDAQADTFVGWQQATPAGNDLFAEHSFNGAQYWGANKLRLPGVVGRIVTDPAVIIPPNPAGGSKLFALYARVNISGDVIGGQIELKTTNCSPGLCTDLGGSYSIADAGAAPKNKWIMLYRVFKMSVSRTLQSEITVGIEKTGVLSDIFVDEVQLVELPAGIPEAQALEIAQIPYAYECPSDQVGCTAYRDPVLTNKTFFYLNDTNLDKGGCNGNVSEKEGCILFNELSNPTNAFNAGATYQKSQSQDNKLVAPVTSGGKDTNLVLKVRRDRTCAEWLSCSSDSKVYNKQTKRYENVCYSLGTCNQYGGNNQGSSVCSNWVVPSAADRVPLSVNKYQTRGNNWSSLEYSGYAIANTYPIDLLSPKEYSTLEQSDIRLTYLNPDQNTCGGAKAAYNAAGTCTNCCTNLGSSASPCSSSSICQQEDLGINGNGPGDANTYRKLCRAYPQSDAPYSSVAVDEYAPSCPKENESCETAGGLVNIIQLPKNNDQLYNDANVCQQGENCECSYQRVTYSDGTNLFYSIDPGVEVPAYFTYDATADGGPINSYIKNTDVNMGMKGFCLERNPSIKVATGDKEEESCLTWLPIDVAAGEASLYEYSPQAGYTGGITNYCSEAKGNLSSGVSYNNRSTDSIGRTFCIGSNCKPNGSGYIYSGGGNGEGVDTSADWADIAGTVDATFTFKVSLSDIEKNWGGVQAIQRVKVNYGWREFKSGTWGAIYLNRDSPHGYKERFSCGGTYGWCYIDVTANFDPANQDNDFLTIKLNDNDSEGRPGGEAGFSINLSFDIAEICQQVVQSATSSSNKAWTDRVLRLNATPFTGSSADELGFTRARIKSPYGDIATIPQGTDALVIGDAYARAPSPNSFMTVTSPFACINGECGGDASGAARGMCIWPMTQSRFSQPCRQSSDCNESGTNNGICTGYFSGTCSNDTTKNCIKDNDCNGGSCGNYREMTINTPEVGRARVRQLFAKEYGLRQFTYSNLPPPASPTLRWEEVIPSPDGFIDESCGVKWESPADPSCLDVPPPTYRQGTFVIDHCIGTGSGAGRGNGESCDRGLNQCSSGICAGVPAKPIVRALALVDDKIVEDEVGRVSVFNNGIPVRSGLITRESSESVELAFYAYNPNGEQMPLKKIFVNWDDGTPNSGATSFYMNHKHHCKSPDEAGYNWGDSDSACIDDSENTIGYFVYRHNYTQEGDYHPSIYVEDNWEWCATDSASDPWKCDMAQPTSWIPFAGTIHVNPPPGGGGGGGLVVTPTGVTNSCGVAAGPYSPGAIQYKLTNNSESFMIVTTSVLHDWILLNPPIAFIPAGGSSYITAIINPAKAQILPPGLNENGIYFTTSGNTILRVLHLNIVNNAGDCSLNQT